MEVNSTAQENYSRIQPYVTVSYGYGWGQMWKYILELLLIVIISLLFSIPSIGLNTEELMPFFSQVLSIDLIFIQIHGAAALIIFSIVYLVLFEWPMEYGFAYGFLRAARNEKLQINDVFNVFQNYSAAVLANLLTAMIIMIGLMVLIIPGIVFACKLAFVPYLVVDKKMDAVSAVKESWRMTRGHAFSVFLIGFLAIFIGLAGLITFGVGIIIAIIWIRLAMATLYYAVCIEEDKRNPQSVPAL